MISARHGKRSNVKPYRFLRPHFPSASCAVTASCAILSGKIVLGKKSNFPTGCCFCRLREREGEGGTEEAAHSQPARPPPRSAPDYLQPRPWPSGSAVTPTHFHKLSGPRYLVWVCGTTTIVSQYEDRQGQVWNVLLDLSETLRN